MLSVGSLVLSLSLIIALPVELTPGHIDGLVQVEATGEDAQHVDDPFEVV
jgi:hypothetical protein